MSGTLVAFDAETGLVVDPLANVMNNGRIMLATSDDPSTHLKASKVGCGSLAELALENAVLSDSDWRLGAIVGADSTSALKPGRSDYLYLGVSQSIPANQGPGYVPNSYSDSFGASSYPSETTIFSVHADGTIISRWTNLDGARVRPLVTEIDGVLHLIADAEAFFGRHAAARRPLLIVR